MKFFLLNIEIFFVLDLMFFLKCQFLGIIFLDVYESTFQMKGLMKRLSSDRNDLVIDLIDI